MIKMSTKLCFVRVSSLYTNRKVIMYFIFKVPTE